MATPLPAARGPSRTGAPERLLEAAGTLFAERGYHGATLREIAERAGTNLAAANYHFGSKDRLYLEVVREHMEALERRLLARGAAAEALARHTRAQLVGLLRTRVRTLLETFLEVDPIHARLMQRELLDPSAALPAIVRRWIDPMRRVMDEIVARLEPGLAPRAVEHCTRSIMGQIVFYLTHRPALLLLMGRRRYPTGFLDEVAEHVTAFSLGGLERLARNGSAARRRARS